MTTMKRKRPAKRTLPDPIPDTPDDQPLGVTTGSSST